ncbi:EF-hand domain-containing protein [soil metagenome]
MPAASPRPLKKSETLEVRLPFETKTAFMARCQDDGRSASDAVRGFIERELSPPRRVRMRGWQALAAALAGLAIGAVAAPSLAQTATGHAAFETLDRNHDGVLTPAEYAAR